MLPKRSTRGTVGNGLAWAETAEHAIQPARERQVPRPEGQGNHRLRVDVGDAPAPPSSHASHASPALV